MNNPVWFSQYPAPVLDKHQHMVVYLDGLPAEVNALREVLSAGEEL
jgi:hypothetical protein